MHTRAHINKCPTALHCLSNKRNRLPACAACVDLPVLDESCCAEPAIYRSPVLLSESPACCRKHHSETQTQHKDQRSATKADHAFSLLVSLLLLPILRLSDVCGSAFRLTLCVSLNKQHTALPLAFFDLTHETSISLSHGTRDAHAYKH